MDALSTRPRRDSDAARMGQKSRLGLSISVWLSSPFLMESPRLHHQHNNMQCNWQHDLFEHWNAAQNRTSRISFQAKQDRCNCSNKIGSMPLWGNFLIIWLDHQVGLLRPRGMLDVSALKQNGKKWYIIERCCMELDFKEGLYVVARIVCLVLPGSCLSKHTSLFDQLSIYPCLHAAG